MPQTKRRSAPEMAGRGRPARRYPAVSGADSLQIWQQRFDELASWQTRHLLHARLKDFQPCLVCWVVPGKDGLAARVRAEQARLRACLAYAGQRANHVMALLWWYCSMRRRLGGQRTVEKLLPDGSTRVVPRQTFQTAQRVCRHRRRRRGLERACPSYRVLDIQAPFFTGEVAIREDRLADGTVGVTGPTTGERTFSPVPPRQARPVLAEDPLRLLPATVATVLHRWCAGRTGRERRQGYLSWSVIADLLSCFTPPGCSLDLPSPASLKREVSRYQEAPPLKRLVGELEDETVPTILRALRAR